MSVWGALGFIALGMFINQVYNWLAWRKYYEGKAEMRKRDAGRNNERNA